MGSLTASAQVKNKFQNESWVRIMQNDTSVNYFTARKDFAKFVAEYRKKEAKSQHTEKVVTKGEEHPHESHLKDPESAAILQFQRWSRSVQPFVTSDGKIMPVEQRMALVNKGKK